MALRGVVLLCLLVLLAGMAGCSHLNRTGCYDASRTLLLNRGGPVTVGPGYC